MVKNEPKKKEQEARCWNCGRLLFCFAGKEERRKVLLSVQNAAGAGKRILFFFDL